MPPPEIKTADDADGLDGLYVRDCEIIRRLGFGRKYGYRMLQRLDRGVPNMRSYPQKDAMFGDRRFWPAVMQWHLDYHRVRRQADEPEVTTQPRWEENFDAPTSTKARRFEHTRADLAPAS
jgi:hypothetical protein